MEYKECDTTPALGADVHLSDILWGGEYCKKPAELTFLQVLVLHFGVHLLVQVAIDIVPDEDTLE